MDRQQIHPRPCTHCVLFQQKQFSLFGTEKKNKYRRQQKGLAILFPRESAIFPRIFRPFILLLLLLLCFCVLFGCTVQRCMYVVKTFSLFYPHTHRRTLRFFASHTQCEKIKGSRICQLCADTLLLVVYASGNLESRERERQKRRGSESLKKDGCYVCPLVFVVHQNLPILKQEKREEIIIEKRGEKRNVKRCGMLNCIHQI